MLRHIRRLSTTAVTIPPVKQCVNCVFFKQGKCTFGFSKTNPEVDVLTGEILNYVDAKVARRNPFQCGIEGKEYFSSGAADVMFIVLFPTAVLGVVSLLCYVVAKIM